MTIPNILQSKLKILSAQETSNRKRHDTYNDFSLLNFISKVNSGTQADEEIFSSTSAPTNFKYSIHKGMNRGYIPTKSSTDNSSMNNNLFLSTNTTGLYKYMQLSPHACINKSMWINHSKHPHSIYLFSKQQASNSVLNKPSDTNVKENSNMPNKLSEYCFLCQEPVGSSVGQHVFRERTPLLSLFFKYIFNLSSLYDFTCALPHTVIW